MSAVPRPCLDCGEPSAGNRCGRCAAARQARVDAVRGSPTARGYDSAWRRLRDQAVKLQPFCSDAHLGLCDGPLTGEHLRWPARTLADVEVVCRRHNSARGPRRVQGRP